jgi:sensor domain CHASE-containing protein
MSVLGPIAALIVGIVIGTYAAQASLAERYVTKSDHNKDVERIELSLREMNGKLDRLLERRH